MLNQYIVPQTKLHCYLPRNVLLAASGNFEEPETGEIGVNPGEGHEPEEALSKSINFSVWDL